LLSAGRPAHRSRRWKRLTTLRPRIEHVDVRFFQICNNPTSHFIKRSKPHTSVPLQLEYVGLGGLGGVSVLLRWLRPDISWCGVESRCRLELGRHLGHLGGGLKSLAPSALSSSVFTQRFFSESHKICTNSSKILPKLSKLTHRGVLVVGELHLVFGLEGELAEDPAEPAAAPGFVQRGLRRFCRLGRGVLLRLLILLVAADFSIVLVGQRNLGLRDVLRKKHRATIYYTSGSAWGAAKLFGRLLSKTSSLCLTT
jgi:hypothetical protein